jgi:hypothetical protein
MLVSPALLIMHLFGGYKLQGDRIYTVPYIFVGEVLSFKNVAQVTFTVGTYNFGASAVCIWNTFYCSFYFIVEAGPATMGVKF